jgi:hypothetical protein
MQVSHESVGIVGSQRRVWAPRGHSLRVILVLLPCAQHFFISLSVVSEPIRRDSDGQLAQCGRS